MIFVKKTPQNIAKTHPANSKISKETLTQNSDKPSQDLQLHSTSPAQGPLKLASVTTETSGGWTNHIYRLNLLIQKMTRRGLPIDTTRLDEMRVKLDKEKERLTTEIRELLSTREQSKGRKFWQYDEEDGYKVMPKILRDECKSRGIEITSEKRRKNKATGKFEKVMVSEIIPASYCQEGYKYPCPAQCYEPWFWNYAMECGYEWQEITFGDQPTDDNLLAVLVKREEFNPGSSAQIKEYCTFMSYPIPVAMKKTAHGKEEKETTDDKALEDLLKATKDHMFRLIQDFREVTKLLSTYVEGWRPNGRDGRLHSTFTFTPATGQLSSRNPNVQNAPSHSGDFGKEFKKVVRAREGRVIVNCVAPGTKVLMRDLTWKNAEEIKEGEAILGFDEELHPKTRRRYFKTSIVTKAQIKQSKRLVIETDRGNITVSLDHKFLTAKETQFAKWIEAKNLKVGQKIRYFTDPWETLDTYDAGWLAGFLDGEGYIGNGGGNKIAGARSTGLGFGQNDGSAAEKAVEIITNMGYTLTISNTRRCKQYHVISRNGKPYSGIRLIGQVRPVRLLPKVIDMVEGMATWGSASVASIVTNIYEAEDGPVVAISTTSKTLVTNGFLSHNCDYAGFHAQMTGYFAGSKDFMRLSVLGAHDYLAAHMLRRQIDRMKPKDLDNELWQQTIDHISDLDSWLSYDRNTLASKLKWIKKHHEHLRNKKAKPTCIAEGELVLTDKGLVPIQNVSLDHKLWDGLEWVSHEGVIYQGEKEVIEYAGLRATADHKVFTKQGRAIYFGQAASTQTELSRTGIGGQAVRESHRYTWKDEENKELLASQGKVQYLSSSKMGVQGQFTGRKNEGLSELYEHYMSFFRYFGQPLGRHSGTLHEAAQSTLQELWGQGHPDKVHFSKGIYQMGMGELAPQELQERRDRPHRQQWTLRAGELEAGYEKRELQQPSLNGKSIMEGRIDTANRVEKSIHLFLDSEIGSRRETDWGRDLEKVQPANKSKVYDIVNAGPRHRFTVSGILCGNCHGVNFGLGAKKMYEMNKDSFTSQKEAQEIKELFFSLFPEIRKFQEDIVDLAHREKKLISPYGYVRRFWEAKVWDARSRGLKNGEDAEKAIAFLPANTAFAIKKEAMLRLEDIGANEEYWLFNEVHDSMMFEIPKHRLDEAVHVIYREMTRPVMKLQHPTLAPEGLVCEVEVQVGESWGEVETVQIGE